MDDEREHLMWLARVGENTYGGDAEEAVNDLLHAVAEKQRAWAQERYDAAPPELHHVGLLAI